MRDCWVSYLDRILGAWLKSIFRKCETSGELLSSLGGPLGPFITRAKILYSLKMIEVQELNELIVFAKIRNKFAHYDKMRSFDDALIKELCDQLISWKKMGTFEYMNNRMKFQISIVCLGSNLYGAASYVKLKRDTT